MRSYEETRKQYEKSSYDREIVRELLRQELATAPYKIVVLDDDPTGVQTVHDVSVYTDWSYSNILAGFMEEERTFYILTNSRAMTEEETTKIHQTIAQAVAWASRETGIPFLLISRGDSTLRGHYPLETQVLMDTLLSVGAECPDGEILIPYFQAGGRYTVENIHYVRYGDALIPAGETEFAKDRTFGYQASDLRDYIEEKTEGRYGADRVAVIALESLRQMDYDGITGQLMELDGFDKMIVNALEPSDLEVFCVSLYRALQQGKRFLFRTAADFVKAVSGISDRPLLRGEEMVDAHNPNGGIIVVGSHTAKTTEQMNRLRGMQNLEFLEFDSDLVLEDRLEDEVARVVKISEREIQKGKTVVAYTKRTLLSVAEDTKEKALLRSVKISEAVLHLVGDLKVRPAFVVAKGGITSSDIGVKALKVQKARVQGQILPGIPVWKTGKESKFPGISYVIFPGNVGDPESLKQVVETLTESRNGGKV